MVIRHDLKIGEVLWIGDTRISLRKKSGQVASLEIEAPPDVRVRTPESERKKEDRTEPGTQ